MFSDLDSQVTDYHVQYMDMIKHWHAGSEAFTGGDALLAKLYKGWDIVDITREDYWRGSHRRVTVYVFKLEHSDEHISMPIITNPFVEHIVRKSAYAAAFSERRTA